jgi:hypothetical protein
VGKEYGKKAPRMAIANTLVIKIDGCQHKHANAPSYDQPIPITLSFFPHQTQQPTTLMAAAAAAS